MSFKDFTKNILNDVRIELTEEFDRNFERKAFFDKPWPATRLINKRGSVMARTNNLRRSVRSQQGGDNISWSSSLAYASLQNEGGEVVVSEQMKRFFWAMYYKSAGAITKDKSGKQNKNERNQKLTLEAGQWKALALKKTGERMKIAQRQFIGDHPIVRQRVEHIIDLNFKELDAQIINQLKK